MNKAALPPAPNTSAAFSGEMLSDLRRKLPDKHWRRVAAAIVDGRITGAQTLHDLIVQALRLGLLEDLELDLSPKSLAKVQDPEARSLLARAARGGAR